MEQLNQCVILTIDSVRCEMKANSTVERHAETATNPGKEAEMEAPLAEEEGWEIARESFVREATHYSLKGGTALALLAVVVFGIFWAINQVTNMPPHVVKNMQDMVAPVMNVFPGQAKVEPVKAAPAVVKAVAPVHKVKSVRRSYKPHRKVASRPGHGHVRPVQAGDDPTGGRVTYSDGMITEYSWNK
jgi:hypothetical protein